jgi:acetyltransferase-like isoleucine patch superfamily enzyme
MNFITKIFRFIFKQLELFYSFLRIFKLKLLYTGITIDYKSRVEKNCQIVCVKGGNLTILNSHISAGTSIVACAESRLSIYNSFIGRNCVITAKEKITIHENCLIAEMVVIRDQDHNIWADNESARQKDFNTGAIEIKENVWIASKATVLKGVSIGEHSVIAASAVVTKCVPACQVWAGLPARFLKEIKPDMLEKPAKSRISG